MSLKQKIGVCLLTGALMLNSCASSSQIKALENKVQNLEQKISRITLANNIRDVDELYLKMIAPTVRVELNLEDAYGIGAGTVLYSKKKDDLVYSYILTASHVVDTDELLSSIDVYEYSLSQSKEIIYSANLIAQNKITDLAVIEVISDKELQVADLIPKDKVNDVKIFDRVYTVGCPTEDPPLQSYGELTNKRTLLGGGDFWRINAPIKEGNSGGGVYLENTKELIGVSIMIEEDFLEHNYKNKKIFLKDHEVIFPHLGIIVSPTAIYDFLDEENLQFIYDNDYSREECLERRR
ncbi:MAG: serine protease [Nanoarchaeota archaeon]